MSTRTPPLPVRLCSICTGGYYLRFLDLRRTGRRSEQSSWYSTVHVLVHCVVVGCSEECDRKKKRVQIHATAFTVLTGGPWPELERQRNRHAIIEC